MGIFNFFKKPKELFFNDYYSNVDQFANLAFNESYGKDFDFYCYKSEQYKGFGGIFINGSINKVKQLALIIGKVENEDGSVDLGVENINGKEIVVMSDEWVDFYAKDLILKGNEKNKLADVMKKNPDIIKKGNLVDGKLEKEKVSEEYIKNYIDSLIIEGNNKNNIGNMILNLLEDKENDILIKMLYIIGKDKSVRVTQI